MDPIPINYIKISGVELKHLHFLKFCKWYKYAAKAKISSDSFFGLRAPKQYQ